MNPEKLEAKRRFFSEQPPSFVCEKKQRIHPLWGFPSPEGIIPKRLQDEALRLIPIYNDSDKRFWISFWIGLLSPLFVVLTTILFCQISPPEYLPRIKLEGFAELLFWHLLVISVGFISYYVFEFYCRKLFWKIDDIYFNKTGKTGEQIEAEIIEELEDGSKGAFRPEYINRKKNELKRQKYKAYVAYAFYGLVIPLKKRKTIKVPIDD